MPLSRPVVMVYQDLATLSVIAGIPDLNCIYVGPAYAIKDYPVLAAAGDEADISIGTYVKAAVPPYTTPTAPCAQADGSSLGRPDAGTTFLSLPEPPDFPSGGVLEASSVDLVLKTAYIQIKIGIDGAITDPTLGLSNVLTSAAGGFSAADIVAGDQVVMSKNMVNPDAAHTAVRTVKAIKSDTELELTASFTVDDYNVKLDGGAGGIRFRVEHLLTVQRPDPTDHVSVVGNQVDVKTGPTGMWLSYTSDAAVHTAANYLVDYATMYMGYRAFRTDLQTVTTISDPDSIETTLGPIDERNPLAVAVSVGMANSGDNPVMAYGVSADDSAGHASAINALSGREDIYAICPSFDNVTSADRISIIGLWKASCVALSDPTKSKFRVVLGSYGELPTTRAVVDPSLTGATVSKAADPIDVFVDPNAATDFETANIEDTDLLDIQDKEGAPSALCTLTQFETIFDATYDVGGSKAETVMGVMGKKRIRTSSALGVGAEIAALNADYAIRPPILAAEGATPIATAAAVTISNVGGGGGGPNALMTLAKLGAFTSVAVGDVVKMTGAATGAYNTGLIVSARTDDLLTVAYEVGVIVGDVGDIEVYRPIYGAAQPFNCTIPAVNTITKAGAFTGAAVGDIAYVLADRLLAHANLSKGMWVVINVPSADSIVVANTSHNLTVDMAGITNVALFRPKAARGQVAVTSRRRLVRLEDVNATFITGGVTPGNFIEIPYPASADPLHWDTSTTSWPVDVVVSEEVLDADLDDLEELAPHDFVTGYTGVAPNGCPYRVSIALDKAAQVDELNLITASLKHMRCVMVWPNECTVTDLENALTGVQGRHDGQYLAAAVGGMIAGLPSHQGFTFIGIAGISQIYNSNLYFSDDEITELAEGGWYTFVQDTTTSAPYSALECTTDTDAYETGELMAVKNLDFLSKFYKAILRTFLGRYNLNANTLILIRGALEAGTNQLLGRSFPRIGTPINSADVTKLQQFAGERDHAEVYLEADTPAVLNKVSLHIVA